MEKKYIIAILIATIIAVFFYAAVWTHENNSLSQKLLISGLVAVGHAMFAMIFCAVAHDLID